MVLQLVADAVYQIVQQSWIAASEIVPLFLAIVAVYAFTREEGFLESFLDSLLEYSEEFVTLIALTGLTRLLLGLEPASILGVYGQLVAFLYFGYLFWKY